MKKHYLVLMGTSCNASGGARWSITGCQTEQEIIVLADNECNRGGVSLEDLAGMKWTEDAGFDREWEDGEQFATAIEVLNGDGRTYAIFEDSDPAQVEEFISQAAEKGLGKEAREWAGYDRLFEVTLEGNALPQRFADEDEAEMLADTVRDENPGARVNVSEVDGL